MQNAFILLPFHNDALGIGVYGTYAMAQNRLHINYLIKDPNKHIVWPQHCSLTPRCNELWQHSCCELFVAKTGQEQYWEYNFSPTGHWNCYRHGSYRSGSIEETTVTPVDIQCTRQPDSYHIAVRTSLPTALAPANLEMAITAVLQTRMTPVHFALRHCAHKADFHQRKSFTIKF